MTDFLAALALAITIEGLLYAAFPDAMKRMMAVVMETPPSAIRVVGLSCAALGLALLWLVRG